MGVRVCVGGLQLGVVLRDLERKYPATAADPERPAASAFPAPPATPVHVVVRSPSLVPGALRGPRRLSEADFSRRRPDDDEEEV